MLQHWHNNDLLYNSLSLLAGERAHSLASEPRARIIVSHDLAYLHVNHLCCYYVSVNG